MSLHLWLKRHPHFREVPVRDGEASIALLLLWEVDHGKQFPSRATDLSGRLGGFTRQLITAVAADTELSQWMVSDYIHCTLGIAVPWSWHRKWSVRIDSAVGEPFLSTWKAHLLSLAVRPHSAPVDPDDTAPPAKKQRVQRGTKRKPTDAPPPPSGSKRARLERLQAAIAAVAASQ